MLSIRRGFEELILITESGEDEVLMISGSLTSTSALRPRYSAAYTFKATGWMSVGENYNVYLKITACISNVSARGLGVT
jgi:hypothetical protein